MSFWPFPSMNLMKNFPGSDKFFGFHWRRCTHNRGNPSRASPSVWKILGEHQFYPSSKCELVVKVMFLERDIAKGSLAPAVTRGLKPQTFSRLIFGVFGGIFWGVLRISPKILDPRLLKKKKNLLETALNSKKFGFPPRFVFWIRRFLSCGPPKGVGVVLMWKKVVEPLPRPGLMKLPTMIWVSRGSC